jgi:hypothetical protein
MADLTDHYLGMILAPQDLRLSPLVEERVDDIGDAVQQTLRIDMKMKLEVGVEVSEASELLSAGS